MIDAHGAPRTWACHALRILFSVKTNEGRIDETDYCPWTQDSESDLRNEEPARFRREPVVTRSTRCLFSSFKRFCRKVSLGQSQLLLGSRSPKYSAPLTLLWLKTNCQKLLFDIQVPSSCELTLRLLDAAIQRLETTGGRCPASPVIEERVIAMFEAEHRPCASNNAASVPGEICRDLSTDGSKTSVSRFHWEGSPA